MGKGLNNLEMASLRIKPAITRDHISVGITFSLWLFLFWKFTSWVSPRGSGIKEAFLPTIKIFIQIRRRKGFASENCFPKTGPRTVSYFSWPDNSRGEVPQVLRPKNVVRFILGDKSKGLRSRFRGQTFLSGSRDASSVPDPLMCPFPREQEMFGPETWSVTCDEMMESVDLRKEETKMYADHSSHTSTCVCPLWWLEWCGQQS